jgi:hypothetical protein
VFCNPPPELTNFRTCYPIAKTEVYRPSRNEVVICD